jgi:hypothetical protein
VRGKRELKKLISNIKALNLPQGGDDIMKILIKKDGMTGLQLSEVLFDKYGIEDEKTNEVSTMLLCGIGTTEAKLERLKKAIKKIGL